jgi:hypothetical protein
VFLPALPYRSPSDGPGYYAELPHRALHQVSDRADTSQCIDLVCASSSHQYGPYLLTHRTPLVPNNSYSSTSTFCYPATHRVKSSPSTSTQLPKGVRPECTPAKRPVQLAECWSEHCSECSSECWSGRISPVPLQVPKPSGSPSTSPSALPSSGLRVDIASSAPRFPQCCT